MLRNRHRSDPSGKIRVYLCPSVGSLKAFAMPRILLLLCFMLSVFSNTVRAGASFQGLGLKVELVSEVTSVRPGQPFYAGLFIRHEAAHHTYWKNPGLAGVATNLVWTLPKGWTAGSIEWPAPDKVKMAMYDTHGYERDVLLMVKITPPAQVKEKEITLRTKASWMCCGRTCNPGFRDLTLTLPVAAAADPAWDKTWHPVFEKERAQVPVLVRGWKFSAKRAGKKITLTGTPEQPGLALPEAPQFFSSDNLICSHPKQVWQKTGQGFSVELEMSEFLPKAQTKLRGLLRGKTGWNPGDPRAVEIAVPIGK
jgi:DsbC/DsbD-like thiol-disulfide interchange protein